MMKMRMMMVMLMMMSMTMTTRIAMQHGYDLWPSDKWRTVSNASRWHRLHAFVITVIATTVTIAVATDVICK